MIQKEQLPLSLPRQPLNLTKTMLLNAQKLHKPSLIKRKTLNITTNTFQQKKKNDINNSPMNNNNNYYRHFAYDNSYEKEHLTLRDSMIKQYPNKSLQSLISNNIAILYSNLFKNHHNDNNPYTMKQLHLVGRGSFGQLKYNSIGLVKENHNTFRSTQLNNNDHIHQGNFLRIEGTGLSNQDLQYHMVENNHILSDRTYNIPFTMKQKVRYSHYKTTIPAPKKDEIATEALPFHNHKQCSSIENSNSSNNVRLPMIKEDPLPKTNLSISASLSPQKIINYNNNYLKDFKDDLNYYDTNKYYYYIIYPENCGYLIKKCMENRINWKESQNLTTHLFHFKWRDCASKINFSQLSSNTTITIQNQNSFMNQCVNHYEYHSSLTNKANMFINFMNYCEDNNKEVFQYVPFTIVLEHPERLFYDLLNSFKKIFDNITTFLFNYEQIKNKVYSRKNVAYMSMFPYKDTKLGLKTNIMLSQTHYNNKNLWIFKASHLNRGRGIKLIDSFEAGSKYIKQSISGNLHDYSEEINNEITIDSNKYQNFNQIPISCISSPQTQTQIQVQTQTQTQTKSTYQSNKIIIQKYIEKPLLYNNRKFDIRIWVLITHKYEVYIFKEGHLKTCSIDYDCNDINSYIHITNYSLQKYNKHFSQYEKGNEVSFDQLQMYLDLKYKENDNKLRIREDFFPKFKEIIEMTCKSVRGKLNKNNRNNCFEIYGYDFMMDELFNIYLIEVNTNPGLEESSDLIKRLVPRMIDDALRLTIDVLYNVKYKEECVNLNGGYRSIFHIDKYDDEENLWEFVCDLSKKKDKVNKKELKQIFKFKKRKVQGEPKQNH